MKIQKVSDSNKTTQLMNNILSNKDISFIIQTPDVYTRQYKKTFRHNL